MKQYVVYLRANSGEPHRAAQEFEAQEAQIDLFLETLAPRSWRVIGLFTDSHLLTSGRSRPQLKAALSLVHRTPGSQLLVATLDRLSRGGVLSAAKLKGPDVPFLVAGTPWTCAGGPQLLANGAFVSTRDGSRQKAEAPAGATEAHSSSFVPA